MVRLIIKLFKLNCSYKGNIYRSGSPANGIIVLDDNCFYICKDGRIIKSPDKIVVSIGMTNGLMRSGIYNIETSGKIIYPDDPIVNGVLRKSELDAKIAKEKEKLRANRKSYKKHSNNHYKLEPSRLKYDDEVNAIIKKLWVRKENLTSVCYKSKINDDWNLINHIRHKMSNYDRLLGGVKRRPDGKEVRVILKKECLYLIGKTYPSLNHLCEVMSKETKGD